MVVAISVDHEQCISFPLLQRVSMDAVQLNKPGAAVEECEPFPQPTSMTIRSATPRVTIESRCCPGHSLREPSLVAILRRNSPARSRWARRVTPGRLAGRAQKGASPRGDLIDPVLISVPWRRPGSAPWPRFLIRDNDDKFGSSFDALAEGTGITVLRTPIRAPNANAVCERFLRSVRRECLDHVIILGEEHLRMILRRYCEYFNDARPHQGIGQRVPNKPPAAGRRAESGSVTEIPILGGLHHEYRLAA